MRNIGELLITSSGEQSKHLLDVAEKLLDRDIPMTDVDLALDENWEKEHRE